VTPPDQQQIEELARAEGEMSWYTSVPETEANGILADFMQKYPFIKAQVVRGGSFTIADQVIGEINSGRVQADVLHVLDPSIFVQLHTQGSLLYYDSPESHVFPTPYKESGYWTAMRIVTMCLAYNPRRVKSSSAPSEWEDLLAPAWRNRIGVKSTETAGSGYAFYYLVRERYGTMLWERLARQQPKVYQTSQQMLAALARGEVDVLAGLIDYAAYAAVQAGQPLKPVWPSEGIPLVIGPIAIVAAAPHPNCARLFMDYILSEAGQKLMIERLGGYSARPGVQPPAGEAQLSTRHLLVPTGGWADYAAKRELVQKESSYLLGTGSE
jgi:iron(III) transport system substrate-binding protein